MSEANNHRHGRWVGIFKLTEECGELVVAALELLVGGGDNELPALVRALENELADTGAILRHVVEANRLDLARIDARLARQLAMHERACPRAGGWHGLIGLTRECGLMAQLAGKIAAFPDHDEHPDGCGNLRGRLEVGIADLGARLRFVASVNTLDLDHIEQRGDDKLEKFRSWFPGPAVDAGEEAHV